MGRVVRPMAIVALCSFGMACVVGVSATSGEKANGAAGTMEVGVDAGRGLAAPSIAATDDASLARIDAALDGGLDAALDGCVPVGAPVVGPFWTGIEKECPPSWAEAGVDMRAWCAKPCDFLCGGFISSEVCNGWLQYTQYWGESGPLFCMYDPVTGRLAGYGKVGGKFGGPPERYETITCGFQRADFNNRGCAGLGCNEYDGSVVPVTIPP